MAKNIVKYVEYKQSLSQNVDSNTLVNTAFVIVLYLRRHFQGFEFDLSLLQASAWSLRANRCVGLVFFCWRWLLPSVHKVLYVHFFTLKRLGILLILI